MRDGPELRGDEERWPALPLEAWRDTRGTLHMWTQIIGKIRLKLTPHLNHWWEVPFYLTSRGLTTTPIPFGDRTFDATFVGAAGFVLSFAPSTPIWPGSA